MYRAVVRTQRNIYYGAFLTIFAKKHLLDVLMGPKTSLMYDYGTLCTLQMHGTKPRTQRLHSVKSVQIESYFWSTFSCNRTRNNSVFGHFSRSAQM